MAFYRFWAIILPTFGGSGIPVRTLACCFPSADWSENCSCTPPKIWNQPSANNNGMSSAQPWDTLPKRLDAPPLIINANSSKASWNLHGLSRKPSIVIEVLDSRIFSLTTSSSSDAAIPGAVSRFHSDLPSMMIESITRNRNPSVERVRIIMTMVILILLG